MNEFNKVLIKVLNKEYRVDSYGEVPYLLSNEFLFDQDEFDTWKQDKVVDVDYRVFQMFGEALKDYVRRYYEITNFNKVVELQTDYNDIDVYEIFDEYIEAGRFRIFDRNNNKIYYMLENGMLVSKSTVTGMLKNIIPNKIVGRSLRFSIYNRYGKLKSYSGVRMMYELFSGKNWNPDKQDFGFADGNKYNMSIDNILIYEVFKYYDAFDKVVDFDTDNGTLLSKLVDDKYRLKSIKIMVDVESVHKKSYGGKLNVISLIVDRQYLDYYFRRYMLGDIELYYPTSKFDIKEIKLIGLTKFDIRSIYIDSTWDDVAKFKKNLYKFTDKVNGEAKKFLQDIITAGTTN